VPILVIKAEVDVLMRRLGIRSDADEAVLRGLIARRKVSGHWVFAERAEDLEGGVRQIAAAADEQVSDWFIAGLPWLSPPIADRAGRDLAGSHVIDLVVRELVKAGRYGTLPMLTAAYLPYLAIYCLEDEGVVADLLSSIASALRTNGAVDVGSLRPPRGRHPVIEAWRSHVLKHAEFLGLGAIRGGSLVAWSRA
jgi:hypothetical protein